MHSYMDNRFALIRALLCTFYYRLWSFGSDHLGIQYNAGEFWKLSECNAAHWLTFINIFDFLNTQENNFLFEGRWCEDGHNFAPNIHIL